MKKIDEITDWQEMIGEVMHADCLDVMRKMPDNCVDLVLTDPPYGIGISGGTIGKYGTKHKKTNWDEEIPSGEIFEEILRVSKNQIIWGGNHFDLPRSNNFIVWDKVQPAPNFAQCEYAFNSVKGKPKIYKFAFNKERNKKHPTQKPLELGRWCLENYTKKEEREKMIVFDPFGGSFAFARACQGMGIKFISCDMEKEYCEIGENRLKQQNLF